MKIIEICESTTAGSVATVAQPMTGKALKRLGVGQGVYGKEPKGSMFTGKKTSKPFANSKINEAAGSFPGEHVTVIYIDGKPSGKYTNASDAKAAVELMKKKHPKKTLELKREVRESQLDEDDLIMVPGQGHRLKSGFIPHAEDRRDHEVEMARGDLYQAHKNSSKIHKLIKNVTEDEGLEGWVQAKITKAADYLNSVRQYLEGKYVQETGGVIAGGGVDEDLNEMFGMTQPSRPGPLGLG